MEFDEHVPEDISDEVKSNIPCNICIYEGGIDVRGMLGAQVKIEYGLRDGDKQFYTGYSFIFVDSEERILAFDHFYPLSSIPEYHELSGGKPSRRMTLEDRIPGYHGKGFGSISYALALEVLRRHIPGIDGFTVESDVIQLSQSLRGMLVKMGLFEQQDFDNDVVSAAFLDHHRKAMEYLSTGLHVVINQEMQVERI
jgi:hypothetical protein